MQKLMARVNPSDFWPLPPGVWILLGLSIVTVAGLAKLNRDGPGVTSALKSLWRK